MWFEPARVRDSAFVFPKLRRLIRNWLARRSPRGQRRM